MMSDEKCINKNPLNLSGTAQHDRLAHYLDPSNVEIDGKTLEDYKQILRDLAKITQYHNTLNQRDGDWSNFFTDAHFTNDNPNIALFNCFVELMQYAQQDINKITAKHLDFYYEEVLQLARKSETPDKAHILFSLANNINSHLIEKGTLLKAGKDAEGNDLFFETSDEIVVNKATVSYFKSIYLEKNESGITQVYAAEIANSLDGQGEELDENNPKWAAFGQAQENLPKPTMSKANIGFAIASNFLLLKEGKRIVRMKMSMESVHEIPTDYFNAENFQFLFSGEEDWIEGRLLNEIDDEGEKGIILNDNEIQLNILIPISEKPVVAYDETVYEERFDTNLPVFKWMINQSSTQDLYDILSNQIITNITLDVEVSGVKELVLQNENGILDPAKPFEPFSAQPTIGSEFYIGSQEVFSKPLTELDIHLKWLDHPGDLPGHYNGYGTSLSEDDFKVTLQSRSRRQWNNLLNGEDQSFPFVQSDEETLEITAPENAFPELQEVADVDAFNNQVENGFIRMILSGPDKSSFKAFGHQAYQNIYVQKAIQLALNEEVTLPNEPYTPKCKSLSIDYKASLTIPLNSERTTDDEPAHFYHIYPFGAKQVLSPKTEVLPFFDFEGGFYIGIEELNPPQNLNLLFQVAEGSENPNKLPPEITWKYLSEDEWIPFMSSEILSDSTNGLMNAGIISFAVPKQISNNNTQLPNELFWIMGTIAEDSDAVCQLVDVHAQAITAAFEDDGNDLSHLGEPLTAGTINRLDDSDSAIRKVTQPYASYGGKLPEKEENYYRRVAERLRHKNRAITIWDFERLILEEFPSVYKVKCLNHTRMNENYSEQAPGHVSLVIVSNLRNQNAVNVLQPTTSLATLLAIKSFLAEWKNPFTTLHVKNPFFEEIQLDFNVRFLQGKDQGFYENQILSDLKEYLSPWAYSAGEDISFEGTIYKSKLIDFVEELDYVDYVTCFKMYHFIEGVKKGKDHDEIQTSKSSAILVSHTEHIVKLLTTDDCTCDDENLTAVHISDGIGTMTVGLDLEVDKP